MGYAGLSGHVVGKNQIRSLTLLHSAAIRHHFEGGAASFARHSGGIKDQATCLLDHEYIHRLLRKQQQQAQPTRRQKHARRTNTYQEQQQQSFEVFFMLS